MVSRFSRFKIISMNYRRDYVNRGERNVKSQSSIMSHQDICSNTFTPRQTQFAFFFPSSFFLLLSARTLFPYISMPVSSLIVHVVAFLV